MDNITNHMHGFTFFSCSPRKITWCLSTTVRHIQHSTIAGCLLLLKRTGRQFQTMVLMPTEVRGYIYWNYFQGYVCVCEPDNILHIYLHKIFEPIGKSRRKRPPSLAFHQHSSSGREQIKHSLALEDRPTSPPR